MESTIRDNYLNILEKISRVAKSVGRNPDTIRLVVVTKTQPVEVIHAVIEAGATEFGENYVEDAIPKILTLEDKNEIKWHMIGHIQSRKAAIVCQNFNYIQSLDSLKLAEKLNRNLIEINKKMPVWLEFNTSGEGSKSGWNILQEESWPEVLEDIDKAFALTQLVFLGLMTVPPYSINPEDSRQYFHTLRKFKEFVIKNLHPQYFHELSIGMSGDFDVAIQEGSTCVRIGRAIFGPRS